MGAALGDILPLALGVAISPIPIIAAILMLLSPKARVTSVGFLLGWVIGILVAVVVFTLLSSALPSGDDDSSHVTRGIIQLVLGGLLVLLAVRNWRSRPKPGQNAELPKWMQAIDSFGFGKAFGLAFLLAAVNPKNLLMGAAAGTAIGGAALSGGDTTLVIVVYTLLAASTVLVPVVGYLIAADRLGPALESMRGWLQKENAVIMAVLLLVIGVNLIGKGIGSF